MFEYTHQQVRAAELIRRADDERLAREAVRARRAARREAAERTRADDGAPRDGRPRRLRSTRTA
ncbi:hypothetical protein ACIRG4_26085 [Streptomyces sp. NPDC102395]|uniref:hypothetical protein n=1 Tax=Streptomyces sp. NPDC102395 TaxID=3366168 RepID=UPI0038011387